MAFVRTTTLLLILLIAIACGESGGDSGGGEGDIDLAQEACVAAKTFTDQCVEDGIDIGGFEIQDCGEFRDELVDERASASCIDALTAFLECVEELGCVDFQDQLAENCTDENVERERECRGND